MTKGILIDVETAGTATNGDRLSGETPDRILNSEAKPVRPMVVLTGESFDKLRIKSGHRQDYKGRHRKKPAFASS